MDAIAPTIYGVVVLAACFAAAWINEYRPSAGRVLALVLTVVISAAIGWIIG